MRFTRLASLSSVAAMLLHCGTFVAANPTFTPHSNDGSQDLGQCQDFRVTYPVGEGLRFVENTNHLIAWQAPDFISNVNITLAKADQTPVAVIGTFEASRGVSGEVPISLNGQEPGEYHFHLEGIGMNCQADSSTFQVTSDSQQQSDSQEEANNKMINAIADATHQDSPYFTNEDRRTHVDQRLSDELYQLQQEHDNAAGWSAQEIDPIQAEEEVEPAAEHNNDGDFEEEHSNADQWQTEEIDDTDDEPVHQDAVGWTDGHENIEGFQQEEIDVNDEQPSNGNGWTEGHDNDAHASGWTDGHENVEGFQEEEIDINSDENNGQAAGWTEQHSNDANATGWTDGHENVEGFQEEEIDIEQDESSSHENDNHATGWTEEHDNDAPTATGWVDGHENAGASDNNEPAWTAEKIANPVVGHTDAVENWSAEALEQENEPSGKVSTGYLPSSGSSGATSGAASHTNGNTIPVLPAEALIANW